MLGERREADTFQCLAWLYDGFTRPPAKIGTEIAAENSRQTARP
jgi:hypothetical protein